ncbi:hypothetical protein [Thermoflexibacter ruber]|uniref:Uncharacterized protein n=1 Tax=Thermoflexibacter ruber TaxID=1003 RepID=A0A1I2K0Q1_9BACT|nr:hypothetical protein [Thermoflexibacter ruber]SFF59878.1 hypothetical protein SAMN04488541_10752 [Thermoflexibacter ruber]
MKKSIVLSVIFAMILVNNLFANGLDTLVKSDKPKKPTPIKEVKKKPEATLSKAEIDFIEEIDEFYSQKYENPLKVLESKIEKVVVVNAEGQIILETKVSDGKVRTSDLPVGAEKLMTRGNTEYYFIID